MPSGIIVQCQAERSQHSNRYKCMKMLKSRLYEWELDQKRQEREKFYGPKGVIAWGSQIRSYVMQPYTMVKDHRTSCEVGNIDAVMDGETGLLTAPGDPEGLADTVLRLFAEPDLRRRLIENGRTWVRRECSRDTMSALTEALYERLRDEPPTHQGSS